MRRSQEQPLADDGSGLASRRELFRLFLAEKHDPEPFYARLADRTIAGLAFEVRGSLVLDLGCGPGHYTSALSRAGARVVAAEMDEDDVRAAAAHGFGGSCADARHLPLRAGAVDAVFCSNMLEHTPDPGQVLDEIERVLCPGGWAWLSWTNWYSPWGGHEIVPFHYLGPRYGLAAWRWLRGEPRKNVPFEALWPTHVGRTLAMVRSRPGLRLIDAAPRYYPSQRWILKVPGLREVATWNCLLLLRRV
jgi:SAM-dependent methyltransferase